MDNNPPAPENEARPPTAAGDQKNDSNNQDHGNANAVQVADAVAQNFLGLYRLDARFTRMPIFENTPVIEIPLNFEYLRVRMYNLLTAAYEDWPTLRSTVNADRDQITTHIRNGCHQLSIAAIYLLYSYLRRKTSRFNPKQYNLYRNRCFFDEHREIPSGLAYLIECFGVTHAVEAFGNNRFIHTWDHQHADGFGLNLVAANAFDNDILTGFIQTLVRCQVAIRRVDNRVPARTLWDSLFISDTIQRGISAETVFKCDDYELPRDVFIAYGLLGAHDNRNRPIKPYGPRLGLLPEAGMDGLRTAADADTALGPRPGMAKPITQIANSGEAPAKSTPLGHLQSVHDSGIISTVNRIEPGTPPVVYHDYHALVYGRGPPLSTMTIMSVARGLSDYEVDGYYRNLFRKGP